MVHKMWVLYPSCTLTIWQTPHKFHILFIGLTGTISGKEINMHDNVWKCWNEDEILVIVHKINLNSYIKIDVLRNTNYLKSFHATKHIQTCLMYCVKTVDQSSVLHIILIICIRKKESINIIILLKNIFPCQTLQAI